MIGFKEKKVGTNLMNKYDTGDQVDGGSIGTCDVSKAGEFSEKFQTAIDPPSPPNFPTFSISW